jgi:hypothetical protein
MRPTTTREPEATRHDGHPHAGATPTPVGTFAAGQSPLGEYEVATPVPVGSFASGLAADGELDTH